MSKRPKNEGSLGEHLNKDVVQKLRSKQSELKHQEEEKQQQERLQRMEERERKEANKSFEELLNESDLNWKSFKK